MGFKGTGRLKTYLHWTTNGGVERNWFSEDMFWLNYKWWGWKELVFWKLIYTELQTVRLKGTGCCSNSKCWISSNLSLLNYGIKLIQRVGTFMPDKFKFAPFSTELFQRIGTFMPDFRFASFYPQKWIDPHTHTHSHHTHVCVHPSVCISWSW